MTSKFAKLSLSTVRRLGGSARTSERLAAKTRETRAPSVTPMVICVSRAFAQQTKKKDNLKSPGDEVEKKERLLVV